MFKVDLDALLKELSENDKNLKSKYNITNLKNYSKEDKKYLSAIKSPDTPIHLFLPLFIHLQFDPRTGKQDPEGYNSDNDFIFWYRPEEAIALLKVFCKECPLTYEEVTAKISEVVPKWDCSNPEVFTDDDAKVFRMLAEPYQAGKPSATIPKRIFGGEYDTVFDLTGEDEVTQNVSNLAALSVQTMFNEMSNLKEAVEGKDLAMYKGNIFSTKKTDLLKINYKDQQDQTKIDAHNEIKLQHVCTNKGYTKRYYAIAVNAFSNGDIYDVDTKTFSDKIYMEPTKAEFRAREGYISPKAALEEKIKLFKKADGNNQCLLGFIEISVEPPEGADKMESMKKGLKTVYNIATQTLYSKDLKVAKPEDLGYRNKEVAVKFIKEIHDFMVDRLLTLELDMLGVLDYACKIPSENQYKKLLSELSTNLPLQFPYFLPEYYKRYKDIFIMAYQDEFFKFAAENNLLSALEITDEEATMYGIQEKEAAEFVEEVNRQEESIIEDVEFESVGEEESEEKVLVVE